MDFGRRFLVSKFFESVASRHFLTYANETFVLAPWGLPLNLGQTWGVLHCAVWQIMH